ncbi:FISUMP domain-containing protein [Fibrobacter sp. UBA3629]|uniref:FISUMP domain-containing protein n=1 Tax=Fibrobacter sp. UBA3629 TaxID=1946530 RepID=UPI0025C05575|nr:FISUMP domain-containing protein [Fibrobacter sp. UBA3629]
MKNFIAPRSLSLPKGRLITIFLLAAFFALSACDDSSSASSDETGVSSSSVESPDSSVTLSGASAESNGSSNETKDKSSSSENKSSSSTNETKVSSDSKSSSSVKSGDSSSSSKDKSSSSSSEKQSSSSVKSSSSSVKPSSSSVASSSSEYKPYNHQKVFSSDSLLSGAYKQFTDKRNGRIYYYLTINGKNQAGESASVTVMAENLNVGIDVSGAEDQSDDSKIERYCYNDDTTNCDKFGGLYQWAEVMQLPSECNTKSCADQIKPNHQGICPDGWRLLTYDDFYIVVHADGNVNPLVEGVRAQAFGGHNYCGYSLIGSGYRTNEGQFEELNETAYWFYPSEHTTRFTRGGSGCNSKSDTGFYLGYGDKVTGSSVRCVKVD